ncbi:MAG: hypothetical protein NTW29_05785 [Bacteroidetes bacterium]|nr:hypothetical protein [Bacteroidota bacterium]
MKAFKLYMLAAASTFVVMGASAQTKSETFKVNGNCGMCKSNIEKAAKQAGASDAKWDKETHMLTVKFNSGSSDMAKIQHQIAAAGYDNAGAKATNEAYNKLPACCQYDREASPNASKASCCTDKCEMKDGKCADMTACKEKGCCKDEAACKANGCCSEKGMAHEKMDCCKNGKCSKEGHTGGDCCKKEH